MTEVIETNDAIQWRPGFNFTSLYVAPRRVREFCLDADRVVAILRRDQARLLMRLLDATTREEFVASRQAITRQYWLLSESIGSAMRAHLATPDWPRVARQSLDQLFRSVEGLGLARIGPDATEDAVFCLSTLRRVPRLLLKVITQTAKATEIIDTQRYRELLQMFLADTFACELHLHLLMLMLHRQELHIRPFVLEETLSGLKSSVRLYGSVREAVALLQAAQTDTPEDDSLELDDEDRELLEQSARDAEHTIRSK